MGVDSIVSGAFRQALNDSYLPFYVPAPDGAAVIRRSFPAHIAVPQGPGGMVFIQRDWVTRIPQDLGVTVLPSRQAPLHSAGNPRLGWPRFLGKLSEAFTLSRIVVSAKERDEEARTTEGIPYHFETGFLFYRGEVGVRVMLGMTELQHFKGEFSERGTPPLVSFQGFTGVNSLSMTLRTDCMTSDSRHNESRFQAGFESIVADLVKMGLIAMIGDQLTMFVSNEEPLKPLSSAAAFSDMLDVLDKLNVGFPSGSVADLWL